MKVARYFVQLTALLLVILASEAGWAQTSNGTLAGSVIDPSGAVVQKASVSAVSSEYGQPHDTRTDSAGTYRLEGLQPGVYSVTITAPGFEALSVSGVILSGSLTTTINGKLQLAAAQQTIEVQASAAQLIDTQSGELGEDISSQEQSQLPYVSLNPAQLALTLPGVQDSPLGNGAIQSTAQTNGIAFSVNGTRPRGNNFLIDGQDNNDYGLTGQAYQPMNYGAIQEVTVLTNSYSAEYGRGGGSVTNYIYKSGTNNFHGDLWENNRNSALGAIPAQDTVAGPVSKNPYDNQNVFGFDLGGPVKKDKLFFFGAVQWDRERSVETGSVFNLPTANGIATLKSLEPNPNISLLLSAIGPLVSPATAPNTTDIPLGSGRPSVEIGLFQLQNQKATSNFVDWNYRMDWQFSDHDTLTGSVIRDTGIVTPESTAALPAFEIQFSGPANIFRAQWVHTISSKLVNELRLSYTDIDFSFVQTPATLAGPLANIPSVSFGIPTDTDVDFPSIGVDPIYPQGRTHHAWQVQESLSRASGRHTLKAGVDITVLTLNDTNGLNSRGSITYSPGGGFSSLGNFIDDFTGADPGGISEGFGNPVVNTRANMFAPYIEDTWRARSNLTVNIGLRYEYWGALANGLPFPSFNLNAGVGLPNATDPSFSTSATAFDSLFSFKEMPDKRNFAPRLGLAYTPHWGRFLFGDGKTVLRAGYGIFYDGLFTSITDNTAESQPNTLGGAFTAGSSGRGLANASTFPGISSTTLDSTLLIYTMASNLHNPLTQQWNVDVQRELPLGLVLTLAYVGTRGEHLFANQDFNPAVGLDAFGNYVYTNSNFGEIEVRTNAGDSWYNAGQVELERKIHSSLFLRAAYTYSKFMDDASDVYTSTGASSFSQILSNQRSDWGPSTYDRRHRFTLAYVWQLPRSRQNTFLRALTDAWQWSGIATLETGTPNTVEVGFDNTNNGHPNSRPNLSNPAAPLTSLGVDGGDFGFPGSNFVPGMFYPFACWDNGTTPCDAEPASAFHFIVPNEVPGNVGRNSLYGPGQAYFDTAIQRDFPIHFWKSENQTISFRTDFFNAFNHPNLFTPSYTMTDPLFDNTAVTVSGGREIRFWLKYSF